MFLQHSFYPLTKDFLVGEECDLNVLLYKITKLEHLVSSYQLTMNSVGQYKSNQSAAERKVLYISFYH